jgi:hypothetical protein
MQYGKFVIGAALGCVPDALIAWAYVKLVDGGWSEFWYAIIVLQALYFALWIKRALWAWLIFFIYQRRSMARTLENFFRENKFPRPEMWVGTIDDYLDQILFDDAADPKLRETASFEKGTLNGFKVAQHISLLLMMGSASKLAIARYARYAS